LTSEFLTLSTNKESTAYSVVEDTLKGAEHTLPDGKFFLDKDGNKRTECRVKWWSDRRERYGDVYMECPAELHHASLPGHVVIDDYQEEVPVFFGHYWLKGNPEQEHPKAMCLDYSVAKGGKLVAARLAGGSVVMLS
jgi:hypothetical protein